MLEWVVEGSTARVIPLPGDSVRAFRGSRSKASVAALLRERRKERRRETLAGQSADDDK